MMAITTNSSTKVKPSRKLWGDKGMLGDRKLVGDSSIYNGNDLEVSGRVAGPRFGLVADPNWDDFLQRSNMYFGSVHPGTCQFLFGDGHVRPLDVDISTTVLGYLATKAGGELIGDEEH